MTLEEQVANELAKWFNDPIDKPCVYCGAAKAVIPIVEAEVKDRVIAAINDYGDNKISLERCAEIIDINYYELAGAMRRYREA